MDFSELVKHNGKHCRFSPNGKYLATVDRVKLVVRDAVSLQIVSIFTCLDAISVVEWSPDSEYVLCGQYLRKVVQVWSINDPDWKCKIDEGIVGLAHACWAPDSRHILTTADFQMRITIWSLVKKSVYYIKFPKHTERGMAFSKSGRFLVVAERREFQDFLAVYSTDTWELCKQFAVDTEDLYDVLWSPDDRYLAVFDSAVEYNVCVYTPDGKRLSRIRAYEDALGVKSVAWSLTGQFLAVGSYDQVARVLVAPTWQVVGEYDHIDKVDGSHVVVYSEKPQDWAGQDYRDEEVNEAAPSKYVVQRLPFEIARNCLQAELQSDKADPKMGVGTVSWSCDDRYLLTRNDNMPHEIFIWDSTRLRLASVVSQLGPVKSAKWDPCRSRLALCTGNGKLYMWSPEGCSIVDVPAENFSVRGITWNHDGGSMLLIDKDRVCCCYFSD